MQEPYEICRFFLATLQLVGCDFTVRKSVSSQGLIENGSITGERVKMYPVRVMAAVFSLLLRHCFGTVLHNMLGMLDIFKRQLKTVLSYLF